MNAGQTVYTVQFGQGTVISVDGNKSVVDFNGVEKTLLNMVLKTVVPKVKVKSYMKEDVATSMNFTSYKNQIVGSSTDRGSMFNFDGTFTRMMKKADEQNSFVGSIIEQAINGKFISEKQAIAVASFAKSNNF